MWDNKKIAIFGVGGVGGYFGGLLARKGLDVTFIATQKTKNAMIENGLKIESVDGDFHLEKVQVTDNTTELDPVDLVLVCVKAPQVPEIINSIKPLVKEGTVIIPLQNGVDAPSQLEKEFGSKVLGGSCKVISEKVKPGHIRHSGVKVVDLGELHGSISHRVKDIKDALDSAGIQAIAHDDFLTAQWTKMIFVSPLSAVNGVTRVDCGVLRTIPETMELLRVCMEETLKVANAKGAKLKPEILETLMNWVKTVPEHTTTSMQRDIMSGLPSELHYQVGAISRIGKELGIQTPVNDFLYYSLLPQEKIARQQM